MTRILRGLAITILTLGMGSFSATRTTLAAAHLVTTCSGDSTMAGSLPYEAAHAAAGDTITFGVDCPSTSPIALTSTISITQTVRINGMEHTVVIDGAGTTQLFVISSRATLGLTGLTLSHGFGVGGAIDMPDGGTVCITNTTLTGNQEESASSGGGAIYNLGGVVNITHSTFSSNSANFGLYGGAIVNKGGTLQIRNSTFSGNSAPGGGAIEQLPSNRGGTTEISNSTFSNNSVGYSGGAIQTGRSILRIINSTFSGNAASGRGGTGGAIQENDGGTLEVTNSTISGNHASLGGAIYIGAGFGTVGITNSTFSSNSSGVGGAFYNDNGGVESIDNDTFSDNTAGLGGAIYNHRGTLSIANSTMANNDAAPAGGAVQNSLDATLSIGSTILANNRGGNCVNGGTIVDRGYNLESAADCGFAKSGDLKNTDPQLLPLASNGGPTQTMALQATSPAIDHIPTWVKPPAHDQRGAPRPDGTESFFDIGAYEYQN